MKMMIRTKRSMDDDINGTSKLKHDIHIKQRQQKRPNKKQRINRYVMIRQYLIMVICVTACAYMTLCALLFSAEEEESRQEKKVIHQAVVSPISRSILGGETDAVEGSASPSQGLEQDKHDDVQYSSQENKYNIENNNNKNDDRECPFRNSTLYRSIYIYEHPNLSPPSMQSSSYSSTIFPPWPWMETNTKFKSKGTGQYQLDGHINNLQQFSLEIVLHDLFTHSNSCLRTYDPEAATLFYVPYMNSVQFHHEDGEYVHDLSTLPHARALLDITELSSFSSSSNNKYKAWEEVWGLTSKYWKRKNGADHVVIQAEPLGGWKHTSSKRGSYHYVHTQRQLSPPIVISVELSSTFVNKYPKCAGKNIVVPYPNPDGRNYNGVFQKEARMVLKEEMGVDVDRIETLPNRAMLPSERSLVDITTTTNNNDVMSQPRPVAMYYNAGRHGQCKDLRIALRSDYECTPSHDFFGQSKKAKLQERWNYPLGMRMATFCPCPGGDSPSAKRMYDAVLAGCIPVILSEDFVWGGSIESDPYHSSVHDEDGGSDTDTIKEEEYDLLDPASFSIRLNSSQFFESNVDNYEKCTTKPNRKTLHDVLQDSITTKDIQRLRKGLIRAQQQYSFYRHDPTLPMEAMREGVLPDGGASHALIKALEERAGGVRWPMCEEELRSIKNGDHQEEALSNKC